MTLAINTVTLSGHAGTRHPEYTVDGAYKEAPFKLVVRPELDGRDVDFQWVAGEPECITTFAEEGFDLLFNIQCHPLYVSVDQQAFQQWENAL